VLLNDLFVLRGLGNIYRHVLQQISLKLLKFLNLRFLDKSPIWEKHFKILGQAWTFFKRSLGNIFTMGLKKVCGISWFLAVLWSRFGFFFPFLFLISIRCVTHTLECETYGLELHNLWTFVRNLRTWANLWTLLCNFCTLALKCCSNSFLLPLYL
jgi:hypothetical protein